MSLNPSYEALTVSTTALSLTASVYSLYRIAVVTVEDAAVRFRIDGADPTATEGHVANAGSKITLPSADDIRGFRVIRKDGTDAKLRVTYGVGPDSLDVDDSVIAGSLTISSVTVSNADGATSVPVQGSAAHDAPAAQNPVQIAGYAKATAPTDVADGDVARIWTDPNGSVNVILRDSGGTELAVGGGTQYDEDTASVAAEKLTMAGVVRKDVAASLVDTDGDRTELIVDSSGKLWVSASIDTTGLATAAKQDTIIGHLDGVEGLLATIDTDTGNIDTKLGTVITSVELIDDIVYVDDADFTDNTSKFALVGGVYQNIPQSITDGDVGPVLLDSNGRQVVAVASLPALAAGTANIGDVDVLTLPADPLGANADASIAAGAAGSMSAKLRLMTSQLDAIKTAVEIIDNSVSGAETQVDIVTMPSIPAGNNNIGDVDLASAVPAGDNVIGRVKISDGVEVANVNASNQLEVEVKNASIAVTSSGTLATADNQTIADDAAFTVATSKVFAAGFLADETAPDSVNEGDAGAARMSLERFLTVTPRPTATGEGYDLYRTIDLDETEEEVKASAGKLYGYYFQNRAAAERFVKIYNNTAAGTTVGTTTPFITISLETDQGLHIEFSHGIPMSTGITIAATTGVADADTGAPGANDIVGFVLYK